MPDETGYGFTYRFVSPSTIEITSYYGYEAEVTVPSTIDGYTVVGIGSFHNEEGYSTPNVYVQKVVLPETVTYIADEAFYDSDDWAAKAHSELREIVLNEGLKTIGKDAFYNNYYLQKIDIPASVTEIGTAAFAKCQNLSDITFRGNNAFLWGGAFGDKTYYGIGHFAGKLDALYQDWLYDDSSDFFIWEGQLLAYKGASKTPVIPDTVSVIGAAAFWQSDITGVTIPSSVKLIGQYAFYECESLTSVDIPGSVERIDNSAFSGCTGMTSITLHEGLKVIGDGGLRDCESLTSLVLPEGLTTLEDTALYDCENIESFSFPTSLVDMERSSISTSKWYEGLADNAQIYCGSVYLGAKTRDGYPSKVTVKAGTKMVRIDDYMEYVDELILPDGLESLIITDAGASYCNITKLNVPESVNYIDLKDMTSLTDITLPTTAVLEEGCFQGCYQIKNLTIPKGNQTLNHVNIGRTANLVLPDDVLEVRGSISNGDPFSNGDGNSYLKSIDLKNVRILTGGALSNSTGLETVTLPDSLITLGDGVFSGCARLRSVKGGKNVRQIGDGCFSGCTLLTDFGALETNVTRVGSWAFMNCGWFHDQPNGVVYFGKAAYAYKGTMPEGTVLRLKDGTVSVTYEFLAGQTELNPDFDQPNLAGLILPQSCKYVDGYAFAGAKNMKFIDLGGVQYIGREAFNNSGCENIVLPDSVRFVGNNAFSAPNVKAIHLNDGLRVLEEGAFFTYGKGSGVTIPASVTYIGSQAFGYCPVDPDNPFGGLTKIDGFVIRGTAGSAAQTYATQNEFNFVTTGCTAHQLVTETVAPTCQGGGFTRETCAVCGYSNVTARSAATGHKAVANDAIEATCTRSGYTGGTHCSACGLTLTQPTQTPALGHDEVVAIEDYQYSAYYGMIRHYCRRCQFKWYETDGGGHIHDYTYQTNFVYATCTTGGYTEHVCACGDSYRDDITPALGHDYRWVIDKVATATENGYKHEQCTRCDATRSENTVIPATGEGHVHSYDSVVTPPTCTERGYTTHTCTCGSTYVDTYVNALGHNYVGGVCTRCGATDGQGDKPCDGGATCPSKPYKDVDTRAWYHESIDFAIRGKLMNGVASDRFDPEGSMTRAMLVTVLWRYAGSPKEGTNRFTDVANGQWYTEAVAWAAENGVVNGVGNNRFDPEGKITREQMAAILYRYAKQPQTNGSLSSFPDASRVSGYAADAMRWTVEQKIIGGSDGKLDPQGNATRSQVAAILMRFIKNVEQ